MITRPIVNIAELTGTKWENTYPATVQITSSSPVVGNDFPDSNMTLEKKPLYTFYDGYRYLTSLGIKKYISPFDNKTLTDSASGADGRVFYEKLEYPLTESTYQNYYGSGIFIDDSGWELITAESMIDIGETYPNNVMTDPNTGIYYYWRNKCIYRFGNGLYYSNGKLVLRIENQYASTSTLHPVYPYSANWKVYSYKAPVRPL